MIHRPDRPGCYPYRMPFNAAGEHLPSNTRLPSTRWAYTEVKIKPAARPRYDSGRAPEGAPTAYRSRMTVQVHFRGGPECWWEVSTGRANLRFPGHMALHDVMRNVYDGRGWYGRPE